MKWVRRLFGTRQEPYLPRRDPGVEEVRHGLAQRVVHERVLTKELRRIEALLQEGK